MLKVIELKKVEQESKIMKEFVQKFKRNGEFGMRRRKWQNLKKRPRNQFLKDFTSSTSRSMSLEEK